MRATDGRAEEGERAAGDKPSGPDLLAIERAVAARWAESDVPGKSLAQNASSPDWSCHIQPSAATGVPGIGYVQARTLADLYARFKTMQGMAVKRRHGWDCHGLGVEVAVAHELGLSEPRLSEIGLSEIEKSQSGKSQSGKSGLRKSGNAKTELRLSEIEEIERYGVERFVMRCRESALRHASTYAAVAERIGCLTDSRKIFYTMDRTYIESVWSSLRYIFDAGLLVRDYRIGRYCPRCRTPLAEHEVRGSPVFKKVTGTSAIVRLPVDRLPDGADSQLSGADLLVWTATPWMLPANTGVAVHPDEPYVVARRAGHGDKVVLADAGYARVLGEGWHIVAKLTGTELAAGRYLRPFVPAAASDDGTGLIESDRAVMAHVGTGIAQRAASYGGGEIPPSPAHGVDPIGADGCFGPTLPSLAGLFFADADSAVVADLSDRGLLFAAAPHRRSQPHCWRCGTPALTRAMTTWYIRTSAIRERLAGLAGNAIRQADTPGQRLGLGGDTADWAVGRTRYWGVPLPIWECGRDHLTCVGSLTELSELAGADLLDIDPHRPAIDKVVIGCRTCGGPAYRVAETLDASYDAGAMPFAQVGAQLGRPDSFPTGHQADLAIAGGGSAGNWCEATTAIAALCDTQAPFRVAISPSSALDERGRPMSGRQGNQADPTALIERHGADAIRWHLAQATPQQAAGKVADAAIGLVARRVLGAYLGSAMFFAEHADQAGRRASWLDRASPPVHARPVLDRWLLSELHSAIGAVSEALEAFRSDVAARRIERFVADLAGWYLRLSRQRLDDGPAADQAAALLSLRDCLDLLTRLMAPIAPHLSDHVWNLIRDKDAPTSVHLATWPTELTTLVDERLNEQMTRVRGIVGLGKAARANSKTASWQPLALARFVCASGDGFTPELLALIASELNVKTVEPVAELPSVAWSPGWIVASKQSGTVALDVMMTPQLRLEGIARSSIRVIKEARRRNGLSIGDRVALGWTTSDEEVGAALTEFGPMISQAVAAVDSRRLPSGRRAQDADAIQHASPELGVTFFLRPLPPVLAQPTSPMPGRAGTPGASSDR